MDTLIQIVVMLRHLVAEILRFKLDDYRVIRTEASDINFLWAVSIRKKQTTSIGYGINYVSELKFENE